MNLQTKLPAGNHELRRAIYGGTVFCLPARTASTRLVSAVIQLLTEELGSQTPLRQVQTVMAGDELYQRVGKVRKKLYDEQENRQLVFDLIADIGFVLSDNVIDPARLRAVAHLGHENPKAKPAYTAHRDTWYANPQTQVNWWIPLFDVTRGDSFAFFPSYFQRAVDNDSQEFDYDDWVEKVGWQNTRGVTAVYPQAREGSFQASDASPFACRAGDIILFSASHLHQTVKNETGLMRFSVDFRSVHLQDTREGFGAPNVDNSSRGSAQNQYVHV